MINIFFHCLTFPYPDLSLYLFPPCLCSCFIYLLPVNPVSPYLCYLSFPCYCVISLFMLYICMSILRLLYPGTFSHPFTVPVTYVFVILIFLYLCYLSFLCYWVIWCIKNYLVITYIFFKSYFAKNIAFKTKYNYGSF